MKAKLETSRRHSLPFHGVALWSLSWGGAIRRQTCGGEHDPEWTAKAQHEAHTTIMGLSCHKNYHNLGGAQAVLMGNPGMIALPVSTVRRRANNYLVRGVDSRWGYQRKSKVRSRHTAAVA